MAQIAFVPISYSNLDKWEACPRFWHVTAVQKIKDTGTKFTRAGEEVHLQLEKAVTEGGPAPCAWTADILNTLREKPGRLEAEKWLSVDRNLKHAPYGVTPWLRAKVDLVYTAPGAVSGVVLDWKTGNWVPKEQDVDHTQLRLTAIMQFGLKPAMQKLTVGIAYTAKQKFFKLVVHRDEVEPETRSEEFKKLYQRLAAHEVGQQDKEPKAMPNRRCAYCPDGTCEYNPAYEF
jgi:CRISPR/Cas system-associated exonuclease Cas4 (RecB family)